MARKIKPLTDTEIKQSKPKGSDITLFDGDGLELLIRVNGTKTWRFRYYAPLTKKRAVITIGQYPIISLKDARNKKIEFLEHLTNGEDPRNSIEMQRTKKHTLEKVTYDFFEIYKTKGHTEKTLIPIDKKYQKRTIQPTGFVTDYHIEPTNNVSQQKFIPFQPAWVSATGTRLPLPVPQMGYMVVDHAGTIFNHSSGLYGTGYAICLSCGRADSMTSTGEYPKYLDPNNPGISHLPLRLTQDDWDEKGEPVACRGSAKILGNIHIGAYSRTDVFELVLRNPLSGEYLLDTTEGRIIATSLAVALRSALTSILGISKNEVMYSIRPTVVDANNAALVLQLFDSVSGGAGFAVSAPFNIIETLFKMIEILTCEDHCESFCSKCLLDNDSRHDTELLDREAALSWLGDKFVQYLILSEPHRNLIPGATYCPITLKQKLTELIRQSPKSISFILSPNLKKWDTTLQPIKQQIHLLLSNEIDVYLLIPKAEYSDEIREFLLALKGVGAQLSYTSEIENIIMQAHFDKKFITIANMDDNARIPGVNWLESHDVTVLSENAPEVNSVSIDTLSWQKSSIESIDIAIEISKELNVKTAQFGKAFWDYLLDESAVLNRYLKQSKVISVNYSDRYLKSPSYLLLLSEILSPLVKYGLQKITIESSFMPNERRSSIISHDWYSEQDFIDAYEMWISAKTNIKPTINIAKQLTLLPHRRILTLNLDSGEKIQIRFDQGMGYWQINCQRGLHRFDFDSSIHNQLKQLVEVLEHSEVKNSASWPTDITIVEVKN
ncbi:integrase arm-type DNA-binding domain-containing protein [Thorsellia kenyensis]|uniref:Integrase arm-type DNA-binding domain-containing protein n=1 Tax=Thorsellia kenyensis TaxID=1549888 RepID=A0ABV6C7T8_9GAMM